MERPPPAINKWNLLGTIVSYVLLLFYVYALRFDWLRLLICSSIPLALFSICSLSLSIYIISTTALPYSRARATGTGFYSLEAGAEPDRT